MERTNLVKETDIDDIITPVFKRQKTELENCVTEVDSPMLDSSKVYRGQALIDIINIKSTPKFDTPDSKFSHYSP